MPLKWDRRDWAQKQKIESIVREMTVLRDNNDGLVEKALLRTFRNALRQAGCSEEQIIAIKRELRLLRANQWQLHKQQRLR